MWAPLLVHWCFACPNHAEDHEESQPDEILAAEDLQQQDQDQEDQDVPLLPADGELLGNNRPGMEKVDPIPDEFLFEASARLTNVADLHATAEDLVVAGVGVEEEEGARSPRSREIWKTSSSSSSHCAAEEKEEWGEFDQASLQAYQKCSC